MKVTILTPAYNEALHLQEMLDSVRAQTHHNWEIILVDDGSTDGTREVIRENASTDPRIIDATPGGKLGKNRAFNTAFAVATGDLIIIAGADDILPIDSLTTRVRAVQNETASRFVAYFKFRTFSDARRFHGQTLPRGNSCSRSSAALTLSRELANELFPIDESLPAEDIYLGRAADYLADRVILEPKVVYHYRIHEGNSNPRHLNFKDFNVSMHGRQLAFHSLLHSDLSLPAEATKDFKERARVEEWRYKGNTLRILFLSHLPAIERLAIASASNPALRRLRMALNQLVSGRRGR